MGEHTRNQKFLPKIPFMIEVRGLPDEEAERLAGASNEEEEAAAGGGEAGMQKKRVID